jgi:hypothetical protein
MPFRKGGLLLLKEPSLPALADAGEELYRIPSTPPQRNA